MATSSRGGASAPKGSNPFAPGNVPANQQRQPIAKPAEKTGKVTISYPTNPRVPRVPVTTITHAPKGPSESDLIFQREVNAIGPKAVAAASNPRVAALQQILGAASGVPALTNAIRSHNPLAIAGNAAMFLPLGRGVNTVRAVAEAARAAKVAEIAGEAPRVLKGATTVETAGDLGRQVREGLRGATSARREQDILYSAERGKRAAAAEQAMQIGGLQGHRAALAQLKGELPKLQFNGFENFNPESIDALLTHVQQHPQLRPFEKIRTQAAILNVLHGKVPTKSELALMQRVFGREVSNRIQASIPFWRKAKHLGVELANVPRSLMASFDLSAPFRQGLVAGARHPVMFAKNFGPMVKAFGSENVYQGLMDDIVSRPSFKTMQEAGLSLTDLEALPTREEQFVSNLAEHIPGIGRGVRASGRAYTGFLNKMRADMFDYYLDTMRQQGIERDPDRLKSIARFINSATGRGDLGALKGHAVTLNTLFFSPRLLASRVNFLNPVYYATLDPFARKQALRAIVNLAGAATATMFLAKAAGAKVNTDPRNADWAKMKFGNTRIDMLGGFQQPIRLIAELASGKVISSTSGKTLHLGPEGPGNLSRYDIGMRFLEQKLAPTPSLVISFFKGTDFADKPFSWKQAAYQRMVPLLAQDIHDLYSDTHSVPKTFGGLTVGTFGLGLQTYGPQRSKPKASGGSSEPFAPGGSSSSGSDFASGASSGGSGNPFGP